MNHHASIVFLKASSSFYDIRKMLSRRAPCFENFGILLKHRILTDCKRRWEKQARFDAAGRFTKWNGWTGGGGRRNERERRR